MTRNDQIALGPASLVAVEVEAFRDRFFSVISVQFENARRRNFYSLSIVLLLERNFGKTDQGIRRRNDLATTRIGLLTSNNTLQALILVINDEDDEIPTLLLVGTVGKSGVVENEMVVASRVSIASEGSGKAAIEQASLSSCLLSDASQSHIIHHGTNNRIGTELETNSHRDLHEISEHQSRAGVSHEVNFGHRHVRIEGLLLRW